MKEDILISIIVPIYNVYNYLEKCILSIINQQYKNIEIILINDGSTDKSLEICKKYKKLDKRIILIDSPNEGVAKARNKGLDISKGKYICFVDGDDYIDLNFVKIMLDNAIKNQADVIECNYFHVSDKEEIVKEQKLIACNLNNFFDISKNFLLSFGFANMVWNKIFTREVIGNIRFKDYKTSEDYEFLSNIYLNCHKKVNIPNLLYFYLLRDSSITHAINSFQKMDVIYAREETFKLYKELNYDFLYQYVAFKIVSFIFIYYDEVKCFEKQAKKKYRNNLLNIYKKYYCYALKLNTHDGKRKIKITKLILRNIRYRLFKIMPNMTIVLSKCFLKMYVKKG